MDRRLVSKSLIVTAASLGLTPIGVRADVVRERLQRFVDRVQDIDHPASVTVSFGAGLNTAQPGNSANHHILPREIRVRTDGVVNFVVAGFHQIIVFEPGVVLGQIVVPTSGLFIFEPAPPTSLPVHFIGVRTAGGPPPAIESTTNPSNAENRVESVSFATPGDYLTICNVIPHFVDGMRAIIKVR
ncbi:MAG: hypothetical protein ABIQ90_09180 [Polaromonas sp.]